MPDPVHCDERMELARLIPRFQALPELFVFRCPQCGHVETLEQPALKGRSNLAGNRVLTPRRPLAFCEFSGAIDRHAGAPGLPSPWHRPRTSWCDRRKPKS